MPRPTFSDIETISREKFLNTLAESYILQDAILGATELSVISTNPEGIINSFNNAASRLSGYDPQEVVGQATPAFLHDPDEIVQRAKELSDELGLPIQAGFDTFVAKARLTRKADRREWTYIRKNGERFPVMLSVSAIWNESNQLTGYLGIATDITEQKKTNDRIIESESHLQALLNSIDDIAFEITDDFVCKNVWTQKRALLFADKEHYLGLTVQEVLSGSLLSLRPLFENAIKKVFKTQQPEYIEYQIPEMNQWRSGKISYINENAILLLVRNITEQKLAERQLQESEYKFRLLAENIPGVVYLSRNDATYSMIYLNDEVEALTGYTSAEFLTNKINFVQLYHSDDVEQINANVAKAVEVKEKFHIQYRIQHRSGEWRWIDEVGVGIFSDNTLMGLEGFLRDITDQKNSDEKLLLSKQNLEAAAQELQEQNEQLNEFAHIISHNLRSPVGNIGALIGLLSPTSTLEDYQLIFNKLKLTSQSLQDTLNDLMETLRIKKEALTERSVLSFNETLTKVKNDLAGEVIRSNAEITSDFNDSPEILYAKTYLESIFLNLLSNALKYRSPRRQPKIHFQTKLHEGKVQLVVSDNGLGIDLEKHGHKLFGLRKTFHAHKEARGVGLFLTKTQVEAMGGKIWAISDVNNGTTFFIQF